MILTKTFVECRWYSRDALGQFQEFSQPGQANLDIDQQVNNWVTETNKQIVHPGQLGMHTVWHGSKEDPYAVKCVVLGLTVLYEDTAR